MLMALKRLISEEDGQGLVEYALIIALISVVVIATLNELGGKILVIFQAISDALSLT